MLKLMTPLPAVAVSAVAPSLDVGRRQQLPRLPRLLLVTGLLVTGLLVTGVRTRSRGVCPARAAAALDLLGADSRARCAARGRGARCSGRARSRCACASLLPVTGWLLDPECGLLVDDDVVHLVGHRWSCSTCHLIHVLVPCACGGAGRRYQRAQQPGLQASAAFRFSVQHRFSRATREPRPATRSAPLQRTGLGRGPAVHTSGRSRRAGARWTWRPRRLGGIRSDYYCNTIFGTARIITRIYF
jgi:hypothetical protein